MINYDDVYSTELYSTELRYCRIAVSDESGGIWEKPVMALI
jgi:hypothetical protein